MPLYRLSHPHAFAICYRIVIHVLLSRVSPPPLYTTPPHPQTVSLGHLTICIVLVLRRRYPIFSSHMQSLCTFGLNNNDLMLGDLKAKLEVSPGSMCGYEYKWNMAFQASPSGRSNL